MFINKALLLIITPLFLLTACSNSECEKTESGNTVISGMLSNIDANKLALERLTTKSADLIDSIAICDDGHFKISFDADQIAFYKLGYDNNNFLILAINPGEKVQVTADATNLFRTYQTEGSEESALIIEYNKIVAVLDSADRAINQAQQTQNADMYYQAVATRQVAFPRVYVQLKEFVDKNPGSLAALASLSKFNIDNDYEYYAKVADALGEKIPDTDFYKNLKQKVDQIKVLSVGQPAPDIQLQNPQGEVVPLSSFKGKVVLVDFWASWCKPCRMENPNVVRLYNKYKDRGFEVYGVSLDKQKAAWTAAIAQDGLTWTHVSDLGFWNSSVVPMYSIKSIPQTYLLDKEGNILAKNLRGEKLAEKLAEVLGS